MSSQDKDLPFVRRLSRELDLWLREGLISAEQKEKISARYASLAEADRQAGPGKLVTTISVLGAVLIGIGIILFIASNWSVIPRWGKLALIFASMISFYGIGFYLRVERSTFPKIGAALILVGTFTFGGGIFLIAQIYHITVHYPNGPLLWGLGVLPLAYLFRLKTILSLALIDLLVWLGMEAWFWIPHGSSSASEISYVTLFLLAGIGLWQTGLMHHGFEKTRAVAGPYLVFGMLTTFAGAFILTFEVYRHRLGTDSLLPFYIGICVLYLISSAGSLLAREKGRFWKLETAGLGLMLAAVIGLSLLYEGAPPDRAGYRHEVMTLTTNILFAAAIVGVIALGYVRKQAAYINIGLFFFVLDVFARYFDFLWKLLPRSLFFIAGGFILLAGGILLERKRRKVLASFAVEDSD